VDVWCLSLDDPAVDVNILAGLLSTDEHRRASAFACGHHQRRFVVARAGLRWLLGAYLGRRPSALRFRYGPHGKPELDEVSAPPFSFNLAHAEGLAVYAVFGGREVGVDIERIRPELADAAIATRFFSPLEQRQLAKVDSIHWTEAFFACWTRKEAYLKARGDGLSRPLDSFDVVVDPARPPALLATRPDHWEAARWRLSSFIPAPGFIGTLAVAGVIRNVSCSPLRVTHWSPTDQAPGRLKTPKTTETLCHSLAAFRCEKSPMFSLRPPAYPPARAIFF